VIHALHIRALKLIAQQKIQDSEIAQKYLDKVQRVLKNDHHLFSTSWSGFFWQKQL
jgi:hypothetical protein